MESNNIIKGFGILNRTFLRYISNAISTKELSYSDSIFLVNIGDKEGTNQEEIANLLAIDTAAVARSVKDMEQKGYIRTEHSTDDRRVKELYLSDTGKELYRFMRQLNRQWIDYVMAGLEPDEVENFTQTIEHISRRAKTFTR